MTAFELGPLPRVSFGEGVLRCVPELAATHGHRLLLLTGAESFRTSRHWPAFSSSLEQGGFRWDTVVIDDEPSPGRVDEIVAKHHESGIEVVVAIGGGSTIDAAKAVAALLISGNSVLDYLEGVGSGEPYAGPALPVIAAPTTAGTGSEATRNAVLSTRGRGGYKRSFRHEALVPRHAVIDPLLLESCPPRLISTDGMDALTQLTESFVSLRGSPFTDALVVSALEAVRGSLLAWYEDPGDSRSAREGMAYAAWISGVALAHTGLGAVHGLASPLGAFFPAPHGAICGTLLAAVTEVNIAAMRARDPDNRALGRYARVHAVLSGTGRVDVEGGPEALAALLRDWTLRLDLPRLRAFGIGESDVGRVVADSRGSSMRTNPIELKDDELAAALAERL